MSALRRCQLPSRVGAVNPGERPGREWGTVLTWGLGDAPEYVDIAEDFWQNEVEGGWLSAGERLVQPIEWGANT